MAGDRYYRLYLLWLLKETHSWGPTFKRTFKISNVNFTAAATSVTIHQAPPNYILSICSSSPAGPSCVCFAICQLNVRGKAANWSDIFCRASLEETNWEGWSTSNPLLCADILSLARYSRGGRSVREGRKWVRLGETGVYGSSSMAASSQQAQQWSQNRMFEPLSWMEPRCQHGGFGSRPHAGPLPSCRIRGR